MDYSLKLITPPILEPVSVEEVKIYAHIDHDVDDKLILSWIKTARILSENHQRRAYYEQVWEMSFDCFPPLPLLIPRPPLATVDFIHYYDTDNTMSSIALTSFIVDINNEPGRIAHVYLGTWPTEILRPIDAVRIRYTCGFVPLYVDDSTTTTTEPELVPLPENLKDAIYLYCGWRNENRSGEVERVPMAFYDLLNQDGFYTP
jgi:uncharacterized phiE125 gp8 family phage protein